MKIRHTLAATLAAALVSAAPAAQALDIVFDYSLDTTGFFTAAKRETLNQVASIFENNLTTSLAALTSVDFSTGLMDGYAGTALSVTNRNIAANTLVFYVGAVDLRDSTIGLAYVGTANPNRVNSSDNGFFSGWGGQMLFDNGVNWYYDSDIRSTETVAGTLDFATVAMHEMGHLFGLVHEGTVPGDNMYPTTNGTRNLFGVNDWLDMRTEGWAVASTTPNLNQVVVVSTPVPEPSAYALMLAGLAAVGLRARRRNTR
ncbi:M12 family metallo-peptidase [Pelomonas sp. UHG3]|uniref:M12 family metallo-peptidase n=1 Tax=Roseateles hydrophilus TaxID=2975054 RepID=A0ACC6CDD6_9BURK|nr:PEP-CTERM sorting domain-containing protein [Pelomonas sp. UHG3]MCY4746468.1 M12 family metallo-peptidase [Pelomonas sp. UHG3]